MATLLKECHAGLDQALQVFEVGVIQQSRIAHQCYRDLGRDWDHHRQWHRWNAAEIRKDAHRTSWINFNSFRWHTIRHIILGVCSRCSTESIIISESGIPGSQSFTK
jgi:hypothetical protein